MPTPTQRIVLQVSEAEYDAIKAAADERAMTVSGLLRNALRDYGIDIPFKAS